MNSHLSNDQQTMKRRKRKSAFCECHCGDGGEGNQQFTIEQQYSRRRLHRACKMVLQETGQSLFSLQQQVFEESKPKRRKQLPKLPPEIWLKIFGYIVKEKQYPFMINGPFVCKEWYNLCLDSSLWMCVRVPYGGSYLMQRNDNFLMWLSENRLHLCREIDLTGWDITSRAIETLSENCPRLEILNLSYCSKVNSEVAVHLTKNCLNLQSIDFSHTSNELVSVSPMTRIIEQYNCQLVNLNLSGNLLHGFSGMLNAICEKCPSLELLSLNNCRMDVISLDIERLQICLLHLRVLNMGYLLATSVNITEKPLYSSPGFRSLQELSIAVTTPCDNRHPLPVNDSFIERMCMASRQLKSLDVRGAERFSVQTLLKLPCPDMEKLLLGIRIIDNPAGLVDLVKMWQHSLTELILSYSCFSVADVTSAVQCLVGRGENPVLESVELENLNVEMALVKSICENCPNLRTVNLQRCLLLPKKLRRFFDRRKIHHFRNLVKYFCKKWNIP